MTKQSILVTGSNGQLGNELQLLAKDNLDLVFLFKDLDLNITDYNALEAFFESHKIDWVVNCAAYTSVDKAEEEQEKAWQINAVGPKNLAKVSAKFNARFIHISTDYVFDGHAWLPYRETDPVQPASYYGRSKLGGESLALEENPNTVIFRTAWLYSQFGHNFVKTMRKYGAERGMLRVVFDQVGSPTWAADLAEAIIQAVKKSITPGVYHFSNQGVCSWYDFAQAIIELSMINCKVVPITTDKYPLPAPRPCFSVFNKEKISEELQLEIPHWRSSLIKCIELLDIQEKTPLP